MDQTKRQTIRRNSRWWMKNAHVPPEDVMGPLDNGRTRVIKTNRSGNPLYIHLTNPRSRHPRGRELGESRWDWIVTFMRGSDFTEEIAVADGFGTVQELKQGLMELNGMTMGEVERHVWAIITWSWKKGPS